MRVDSRVGVPRALLKITYACNNRCLFCHAAENRRAPFASSGSVLRKARAAGALGVKTIVLSGGEPTLHKELFKILEGLRALGLRMGLCTNGRMLSYPPFAERFLSYRPSYMYFSLHGADERAHDGWVRAPAFRQTMRGLENVRHRCPEITVNVVVHHENMNGLDDLVEGLAPLAPIRVKFSLLEPKGAALAEGGHLAPDVAQVARRVAAAIRAGESRHTGAGLAFGVDGFPPCLLPEYDRLKADLRTDGILFMSEAFEDGFFPVDEGRRDWHIRCADCERRSSCPGVYEGYLKGFGSFDPKPFPRTLPNSFAFVRTAKPLLPMPGDCPVPAFVLRSLSPARDLILREGGRLGVFHTDTRDFPDEQVESTKREFGQIYVERGARRVARLHFRHHFRKLVPARPCRKCDRSATCPRVFVRSSGDPYRSSEKVLRRILAGLKGRVIDVGCGEPLYSGLWAGKVRRKEIDYLGVDPTPPAASRGLIFRACTIEDFDAGTGETDAFVVLRSYNHFRDIRKALETMTFGLRPGGDLVLVDNIAFGLVRKNGLPPKTPFEHYRNHTSHDALAVLRDFPVRVVEHLPVTPESGNQWLVHAKRTESPAGGMAA